MKRRIAKTVKCGANALAVNQGYGGLFPQLPVIRDRRPTMANEKILTLNEALKIAEKRA